MSSVPFFSPHDQSPISDAHHHAIEIHGLYVKMLADLSEPDVIEELQVQLEAESAKLAKTLKNNPKAFNEYQTKGIEKTLAHCKELVRLKYADITSIKLELAQAEVKKFQHLLYP